MSEVEELEAAIAGFLIAASAPRDASHRSGTLDEAESIRSRHPEVSAANIYTAAVLGEPALIETVLRHDPQSATAPGGPYGWNALTHLCFSRYLRLQPERGQAFAASARMLLEAGANANTRWLEQPPYCGPEPAFESVIYGAAAVAGSVPVTGVLLEFGADPNDDETPYHVPESYDNTVLHLLLAGGKFTASSKATMLVRKADIHDLDGMKLVLENQGDPRTTPVWGFNALQQALRRDNRIAMIELLLDHGADPLLTNPKDGRSAVQIAARRGRGDVLRLFAERGQTQQLSGEDALCAACALGESPQANSFAGGGSELAEFSGNGNLTGVRCLLELGIPVDAPYVEGDPYFEIPPGSTALHVAAWRGRPEIVRELIFRGANVDARDRNGRTPLALAVRACVNSHWMDRRSPDSVAALLAAGASPLAISAPCGYAPIDQLLSL